MMRTGECVNHSSLLRTFFFDLYLQLIWGYFWKYKEGPFLRPLRSKDNRCWILRLQPRNFVIISENLTANLKKVRQTSVWQMVPKFFLHYLQEYSLRNNKKGKKAELWNHLSYRGLIYFFEVGSQTFRAN